LHNLVWSRKTARFNNELLNLKKYNKYIENNNANDEIVKEWLLMCKTESMLK
jgi:hypothetical protein